MRGPENKQNSLFSYTDNKDRIAADLPLRRIKGALAGVALHKSRRRGLDRIRAEALLTFAACSLSRPGNLLAPSH